MKVTQQESMGSTPQSLTDHRRKSLSTASLLFPEQAYSLRSSFSSSSRASSVFVRTSVLFPPEIALDLHNDVPSVASSQDDTSIKTNESSIGFFVKGLRTSKFILQCWRIILAISGLIDFVASIVAPVVLDEMQKQLVIATEDQLAVRSSLGWGIFKFLSDNEAPIAGLFHFVWMIDGFIVAHQLCRETICENDRQRLLLDGTCRYDRRGGKSTPNSQIARTRPRTVYMTKIICQLALLPIGFYTRIFNAVTMLLQKQPHSFTIVQFEDDLHKSVKVVLPHVIDYLPEEHEIFTVNARSSTAIVLLRQLVKVISVIAHSEALNAVNRFIRRMIPGMLRSGIRHPIRSIQEGKSILRKIRLLKFLFPLILAQNRLIRYLGSFVNMLFLKIVKQSKDTRLSDFFTEPRALPPPTELTGSQRIRKEKELQEFFAAESHPVMHMCETDRRTFYHLHSELSQKASSWINRRLLMRPNSKFILRWRMLFVVCALFETSMLILKPPGLQSHQDLKFIGKRPQKYQLEKMSLTNMPPSQFVSWQECQTGFSGPRDDTPVLRRWLQKLTKRKGEHLAKAGAYMPAPWYCREAYANIRDTVRVSVGYATNHFMTFVGAVCIADMYVTFFTGKFDPNSGSLVAKSSVQRWIIPGVLSQILVNPKLENIALIASQIVKMGPARIWRWFVVIFFPVLYSFYTSLERRLWLPMVARHNQIDAELDMVAKIVFVEDASDSEMEDDLKDSSRNLRPSQGQWMEPTNVRP